MHACCAGHCLLLSVAQLGFLCDEHSGVCQRVLDFQCTTCLYTRCWHARGFALCAEHSSGEGERRPASAFASGRQLPTLRPLMQLKFCSASSAADTSGGSSSSA